MTGLEFVMVLGWVLFPPLVLAIAVLVVLHRRNAGRVLGRTVGAVLILLVVSVCMALGFVIWSPLGLGRYIGIRDVPVMWAPFAFIAVAFALPVAIWWASRGSRQ